MTLRTGILFLSASFCLPASDWLRFRGPNGTGLAGNTALPGQIGPGRNVAWKVAIPKGKSSPVVIADRIFLTGHSDGKLITFALDRQTGSELWRREAPGHRDEKRHTLNDPAAPSPVSDGSNVYVFFAGFGLVSYTKEGHERWRHPLGPFTNFHGMGASPVLAGGKVLMICDQDQQAFLIAVDQKTGKTAWRVERPEMVHSFSTPVLYRHKGRDQVIVPGSYQMTTYDVETGKLVWRIRGLTYQVKSVPVVDGDLLYFNGWAPGGEPQERIELPDFPAMLRDHDKSGDGKLSKDEIPKNWHPGNWDMQDLDKDGLFDARDWQYYSMRRTSSNAAMAVKLGGEGDITDSHVLWRYQKALPDVPAVLLYGGALFLVRNGGILQTLDPKDGKLIKQGRLPHALDEYYASPVGGDGKVYLISRQGNLSVLKAAGDWSIESTADFDEEVFATPAIADGHIWVRTASSLYDFAIPTLKAERYDSPRAGSPVVIDGKLDDAAWQKAPWTADFVDIEGSAKPAPRFRTRARMLWDDRYFYIGADMEEPQVWATLTRHDSVIFHDNDFEVFIDPNGDRNEYFEFEINALNTSWDLFLPKPYRDKGTADNGWEIPGLKTAVHVRGTLNNPADRDDGWSVEIAIPWAAFGARARMPLPPRAGDEWRVNFSRVEWTQPKGPKEDNWVWSPQGLIDMHLPERWGWVRFVR